MKTAIALIALSLALEAGFLLQVALPARASPAATPVVVVQRPAPGAAAAPAADGFRAERCRPSSRC
jgi:hypothetical protein